MGNVAELKKLLKGSWLTKPVPVDEPGCKEFTPLIWASFEGYVECARVLLEHKASVHKRDWQGWTALHWACERGHAELAALLLNHEAEINACNNDGATSLILAAQGGKPSCVKLLLERKADTSVKLVDGDRQHSALDFAKENKFDNIVALLQPASLASTLSALASAPAAGKPVDQSSSAAAAAPNEVTLLTAFG